MQQLLMVLGWTCCCLQARRRARSPSSGSDEDAQVEDDSDFAEALAAEENWGRPQRRAAQNANKALKVWTRGQGLAWQQCACGVCKALQSPQQLRLGLLGLGFSPTHAVAALRQLIIVQAHLLAAADMKATNCSCITW
jgi:hypothetical protein